MTDLIANGESGASVRAKLNRLAAAGNQPWVFATFSGLYPAYSYRDARELKLLTSADGKTFSPLRHITPTFTPPNGATVRDPSLAQWGNGFLLAYTRQDAISNDAMTSKVDVVYSDDLENWSLIAQPDFADTGLSPGVSYVWAPELLVDDDGEIYLVAGPRTGTTVGTAGGGGLWIKKAVGKDPTSWGTSAQIMAGSQYLDGQLSKHNGRYYLTYVNFQSSSANYIEMAYATTPLGPYTSIYTGSSSAVQSVLNNVLGGDFEGPSMTWLPDEGKVRLYTDNRKLPGMHLTEATYTDNGDGSVTFGSWSAPSLVKTSVRAGGRHGTILKLSGIQGTVGLAATISTANQKAIAALVGLTRAAASIRSRARGLTFTAGAGQKVTASGLGAGTNIGTSDFSMHWLIQRTPTRETGADLSRGLGFLSNNAASGGDVASGLRFWYQNDELVASLVNSGNNGERSHVAGGLSAFAYSGEIGLLSFERASSVVSWRWNGQKMFGRDSTSGTSPPDWTQSIVSSAVGCGDYNGSRPYNGNIHQFFVLNFVPDDDLYMMLVTQGVFSEVTRGLTAATAIGSLSQGARYSVTTVGTSNWAAIGGGSPSVGAVFQSTGAGAATGGGFALRLGALVNWEFRDGTGTTATDASGNAISGTVAGTPAWITT